MPDFARKAAKRVARIADDDEAAHAALFVRPRSGETTKVLGAPGGVLSHVGRLADDTPAPTETTATVGDAFARNAVLVLTGRRLLVFGHGSLTGRVKDLVAAFDLDEIRSMRLDAPAEAAATLDIDFIDGTEVHLVPGSRRRRFVETFDELRCADT